MQVLVKVAVDVLALVLCQFFGLLICRVRFEDVL